LRRLQGDFAAAEAHLNQALSAGAGRGENVLAGVLLINLGDVAFDQGNLPEAKLRFQRADAIIKAIDPERPVLTYLQRRLGQVLFAQGELSEAESRYKAALAKDETRYPRSIVRSEVHHALGELALRRGDLDQAEQYHRAALSLREELAPGSLWEAESCHALGTVARRRGRMPEALALFRRAVSALEIQVKNLGTSPEVRARFRAGRQAIYRDLEELLLELDRPEEAFQVVESSRARSLLALLGARDLEFAAVPEPLARERRLADAEYDRALAKLGANSGADEPQRAQLRQALDAARHRQDEARAQIRAAVPRQAAMSDPRSLDLAGVRRVLAPGTLLLTYSLGWEGSRVYALGPGPEDFAVARLDLGEVAVREEVRRFREAIQTARGRLGRRALLEQSERLGQRLLSPIAGQIERAERVLVVPDGALHLLPFGALGLPALKEQQRFLIEAKPLHIASSVTLYAELSRPEPEKSAGGEVVGFGDPQYARGPAGDGPQALRSALRSGLRLDPLPWTRNELKALGLLAPGSPQLWLGAEATEERAKALGGRHRIVHFACHGLLDEAFPLESGLALSIPPESKKGGDNGLLQAWEILENLRLDADLVTLSACQTALGKEVAGEGLLGLTWAFQYAGARSVLASLWEVSDASTAELMRHFYGQLGRGVPKAEALRRAQLELLKRPATAAPFYWAAFGLVGDWR
ncbi:MAG TPA: CHAT domain-containing protein, partial [Vicinamibacteria bacterium]|nr:CHAT domain-containing protein [Vicinamibacteria bacterium]